jgi:hypothetical protein
VQVGRTETREQRDAPPKRRSSGCAHLGVRGTRRATSCPP